MKEEGEKANIEYRMSKWKRRMKAEGNGNWKMEKGKSILRVGKI